MSHNNIKHILGARDGIVDMASIPRILDSWIVPGADMSRQNLESIIGNKATINLAEFIRLCDALC